METRLQNKVFDARQNKSCDCITGLTSGWSFSTASEIMFWSFWNASESKIIAFLARVLHFVCVLWDTSNELASPTFLLTSFYFFFLFTLLLLFSCTCLSGSEDFVLFDSLDGNCVGNVLCYIPISCISLIPNFGWKRLLRWVCLLHLHNVITYFWPITMYSAVLIYYAGNIKTWPYIKK